MTKKIFLNKRMQQEI